MIKVVVVKDIVTIVPPMGDAFVVTKGQLTVLEKAIEGIRKLWDAGPIESLELTLK